MQMRLVVEKIGKSQPLTWPLIENKFKLKETSGEKTKYNRTKKKTNGKKRNQ